MLRETVLRHAQKKSNKGSQQQGGGKHGKDRFKKPIIKQEVSDEDVAKQVKETLARLTNKGKNKAAKYRKEKRENIQNRQMEQEELEQERKQGIETYRVCNGKRTGKHDEYSCYASYLYVYERGYHGVYQPAFGCRSY